MSAPERRKEIHSDPVSQEPSREICGIVDEGNRPFACALLDSATRNPNKRTANARRCKEPRNPPGAGAAKHAHENRLEMIVEGMPCDDACIELTRDRREKREPLCAPLRFGVRRLAALGVSDAKTKHTRALLHE